MSQRSKLAIVNYMIELIEFTHVKSPVVDFDGRVLVVLALQFE